MINFIATEVKTFYYCLGLLLFGIYLFRYCVHDQFLIDPI